MSICWMTLRKRKDIYLFIYFTYIPWVIRGKSHLSIGLVNMEYWKLKEEALDRIVWRTLSRRGNGPVIRQ